jgi:hypothetical protein
MRRYFMVALILLTALRGMVGDAMALEMSRMHSGMADVAAQVEHLPAEPVAARPCHEVMQDSAATEPTAPECTSCQVCHSPVLPFEFIAFSQVLPLSGAANRAALHWVSAELIQLQKPPVS